MNTAVQREEVREFNVDGVIKRNMESIGRAAERHIQDACSPFFWQDSAYKVESRDPERISVLASRNDWALADMIDGGSCVSFTD